MTFIEIQDRECVFVYIAGEVVAALFSTDANELEAGIRKIEEWKNVPVGTIPFVIDGLECVSDEDVERIW